MKAPFICIFIPYYIFSHIFSMALPALSSLHASFNISITFSSSHRSSKQSTISSIRFTNTSLSLSSTFHTPEYVPHSPPLLNSTQHRSYLFSSNHPTSLSTPSAQLCHLLASSESVYISPFLDICIHLASHTPSIRLFIRPAKRGGQKGQFAFGLQFNLPP